MDAEEKVREARLRRMARRQGLDLRKSRRRDPQSLDYGGYHLIDPGSDSLIFGELAGQGFGASLDDIEAYLARPNADRRRDRAVSAGQSSGAVVVERVPVPKWANDLILRRPDEADLLILPQRVRDGRGEYGMDDLVGVKALREVGVRADWAHAEPEDRTFASEYSAEVAVSVVLFVGQSLAQEGVIEVARWLLARVRQALGGRTGGKTATPVVVQVDRLMSEGNRREIEGLRVSGQGEQVVEVVTALLQGGLAPK